MVLYQEVGKRAQYELEKHQLEKDESSVMRVRLRGEEDFRSKLWRSEYIP